MASRRIWWIASGIVCAFLLAGYAATRNHEPPPMHWRFLAGETDRYNADVRELGWSAESSYIDHVTVPGYADQVRHGPAALMRENSYRLDRDFKTVVAEARPEILARGGSYYGNVVGSEFFTGDSGRWRIIISPCSQIDPKTGRVDPSRPRTGVKVFVRWDENAAGVVKRSIRNLLQRLRL